MRAGRLVSLLLLLEARGQMTAAELAAELEVSVRTIMRDIEALSGAGVPVFAHRGRAGGFELLATDRSTLSPQTWPDRAPGAPVTRRGQVRVSPEGRRMAAVLQSLQPLRVRRTVEPDDAGWVEASFRLRDFDGAAREILALGPEIEVLAPPRLRAMVAELSNATADLYREGASADGLGER